LAPASIGALLREQDLRRFSDGFLFGGGPLQSQDLKYRVFRGHWLSCFDPTRGQFDRSLIVIPLGAGRIDLKRPQGGFTQVGAAFADEKQLQIPQLNAYQPTKPVPLDDDTTLYPKDVDGFIQEMQ